MEENNPAAKKTFGQLGKRLLSSAVLISITIAAVFLAPKWLFFLIVEGFILLAFNEFVELARRKGVAIDRFAGLFFAALIPFSVYFSLDSLVWMSVCLVLFIVHFRPGAREHALVNSSVMVFGLLYISWFPAHLIKMRDLQDGAQWVFYTILIAKGGDAGAYFIGKNFGKNKLIEHISPNKSMEGAVGGFVISVILSLFSKIYLPDISMNYLLVLGILVGVLAQLGDLGESLLKRDAGIKDSGQVPGLGGILDVLDSLLLTAPFVYFYAVFVIGVR